MELIWIGLAAAAFTTSALLPQIFKALKTKKTVDVSMPMLVVLGIGFALWLVYGIGIGDIPLMITNSLSLSFGLVMIGLKLRYG